MNLLAKCLHPYDGIKYELNLSINLFPVSKDFSLIRKKTPLLLMLIVSIEETKI